MPQPQLADPRAPQPPNLPDDFRGHSQYLLQGNMLREGNPYTQDLLGQMRREEDRNYGTTRARIGASTQGAGQFGSSMGQNLQGKALQNYHTGLADRQNATMFGVHESERDRMMQALQGLGAFDTAADNRTSNEALTREGYDVQMRIAELQRQSQAAAASGNLRQAQIHAESARELQENQLGFDRMSLALQGMLGFGDQQLQEAQLMAALTGQSMAGDQGMLGMAGQMAGMYGDQALGAWSLAPGMEGAGYTGLMNAFGTQQQMDEMSARNSAARFSAGQAGRNQPMQDMNWYANLLGMIGAQGGQSAGFNPGQAVGYPNPYAAAAQGGIGGAISGAQIDWGQLFGGGGGAGGAAGAGGAGAGGAYPNPYANNGVLFDSGATGGSPYGNPSQGGGAGGSSGGAGSFGGFSTGGGNLGFGHGQTSYSPGQRYDTTHGMALQGQPGFFTLPSGEDGVSPNGGPWWDPRNPYINNPN